MSIDLNINGEKRAVPVGIETIDKLLQHLEIKKELVVVEHNLKILKKNQLETAKVQNGDSIEIVKFVGGG